MDWSSLGGIALALIGILLGQAIEGGQISSLLQPAAFLIVICGTCGAVLLQSDTKSFLAGLRMASKIFSPPADDRHELARRIIQWSQYSRKEGVFMLESYLERETEPFIQKGLRLVVDGTAPDNLKQAMEADMHFYEVQQRNAAKIWTAAGGYSPTIGILGAVLGLIHVMENLSDPSKLGSGIAVAFVATIYGVGLANLVFLPISHKLKALIQQEMARREMLLKAWVSIASGENSKVIEDRIFAYLP